MKWVADENVDSLVVEGLRAQGHRVWYVCEMDPGLEDPSVLALAEHEGAVLLTADKDFGDMVFRQHAAHRGVVLLRLPGLSTEQRAGVVLAAIQARGREMSGAFTLIAPRGVRIRPRAR